MPAPPSLVAAAEAIVEALDDMQRAAPEWMRTLPVPPPVPRGECPELDGLESRVEEVLANLAAGTAELVALLQQDHQAAVDDASWEQEEEEDDEVLACSSGGVKP